MKIKLLDAYYRNILILICVGIFSGCASMSKDECRTANWETVGLSDGSKGRAVSEIGRHQKACAGIVTPDLAAYRRGHFQGVIKYCTSSVGYSAGAAGRSNNAVCQGDVGAEYNAAYQYGLDVYNSKKHVSELTSKLKITLQEKVDTEYQIKILENKLVSPGLPRNKRIALLNQSKELAESLPEYDEIIMRRERELISAINRVNAVYENDPYGTNPPMRMPVIEVEVSADLIKEHNRHENKRHEERHQRSVKGRPDGKEFYRVTKKLINSHARTQCGSNSNIRHRNRVFIKALNDSLSRSKLSKYRCHASSVDKNICNNLGENWGVSLSCSTTIEKKPEKFGMSYNCNTVNRKVKCRPVKHSVIYKDNQAMLLKKLPRAVKAEVKRCVRKSKEKPNRGVDRLSKCLFDLVSFLPSKELCRLVGNTADNNPITADRCWSALSIHSKNKRYCKNIVWKNTYKQCINPKDR